MGDCYSFELFQVLSFREEVPFAFHSLGVQNEVVAYEVLCSIPKLQFTICSIKRPYNFHLIAFFVVWKKKDNSITGDVACFDYRVFPCFPQVFRRFFFNQGMWKSIFEYAEPFSYYTEVKERCVFLAVNLPWFINKEKSILFNFLRSILPAYFELLISYFAITFC